MYYSVFDLFNPKVSQVIEWTTFSYGIYFHTDFPKIMNRLFTSICGLGVDILSMISVRQMVLKVEPFQGQNIETHQKRRLLCYNLCKKFKVCVICTCVQML